MSKTAETTEAKKAEKSTIEKISTEVRDIAERYVASATVDNKAGVITPAENFYYDEHKAVGHTKEVVDSVHHQDKLIVAGVAMGNGQLGIQAMVDNPELKEVTSVMPTFPGGRVETFQARESVGRNVRTGEPVTSHGRLTVDFITGAGDRKGDMAHVSAYMKEIGAEALSKK